MPGGSDGGTNVSRAAAQRRDGIACVFGLRRSGVRDPAGLVRMFRGCPQGQTWDVQERHDDVSFEVFTYVVVLQAGVDGRATLPITVCARPGEAEHAARVIAYLELVVLGRAVDDGTESL